MTRPLTAALTNLIAPYRSPRYFHVLTIVEKAFAKRLPWASKIYSFAKRRTLWGIRIVVLLWCSCDGRWGVPVGFRLWRPERSCRPERYRTKLQLADDVVSLAVAAGCRCATR